MTDISQMSFQIHFWKYACTFLIEISLKHFPGVQLTICHHAIIGDQLESCAWWATIIDWTNVDNVLWHHTYRCNDVIMTVMASQITSLTIVYSTFYSSAEIKENIKAPRHWPLWGEFTGHRWIPRKKPVTRKMFPFDDIIMSYGVTKPQWVNYWNNLYMFHSIMYC